MRSTEDSLKAGYLDRLFGGESALHQKIRAQSSESGVINMQVSAFEGRLLQFLSRLAGAKKIVEVGSLFGYSALWFLETLPADGQLYLFEKEAARVDWMRTHFKDHPKFSQVKWYAGDAIERLREASPEGPFDLCFIDANKAAYPDYLTWAEKNIRTGGLIIGDNTFLWGGVYQPLSEEKSEKKQALAMREFNERLADRARFNGIIVPTGEGLTVGQKLF